MAAKKYLKNLTGRVTEQAATVVSAGAGNDGDLVALDATGRLDTSVMPVGVTPEVAVIQASEALNAGDFVNVHNAGGSRVRKADASTTGKEADGFVLSAVASGANATVYFEGTNTAVTGATPGDVFLSSTTPGGFVDRTTAGAYTGGAVIQQLGNATSASTINFEPGTLIVTS